LTIYEKGFLFQAIRFSACFSVFPLGRQKCSRRYPNDGASEIVLLFHQAGFSRGEFKNIAPRLVDSGFECLAVDF